MVKTIGDLFEENDDWVNDEEAVALERIVELKRDYIKCIHQNSLNHYRLSD